MKKKRIASLLLAIAMMVSLCACGDNSGDKTSEPPTTESQDVQTEESTEPAGPTELGEFQPLTYEERVVYDGALGEFYTYLENAKKTDNLSERYALMALAEAKMLESGVMVPIESEGGNYAMSRVPARTAPTPLYGSDNDRFETSIVADEFITAEQRKEIVAKWLEDGMTADVFMDWVKQYLTDAGYTFLDSYSVGYTSDPETWDVLSTFKSVNSEPTCMTLDGLVMHDVMNTIQPALAESWEESEDGLTWTFHIREGVKWVDAQGREIGEEVKADDWVAAMEHVFDCQGGQEELYSVIKNASAYAEGDITDFSEVGIKAVDDRTLVYTLEQKTPYFLSMLTYCGAFGPMCRSYYESQGGKFGADFAPAADSYNYGKSPTTIAYCGPFLVTNWTEKNSINYKANPTYWNADSLNVHELKMLYNDGSDALKAYNDAVSGVLSGAGLGAPALEQAKKDGLFEDYCYVASSSGATFMGWYNLNRQIFVNYDDETKAVSSQSHASADEVDVLEGVYTSTIEDDAARTHRAMNNQNFRLALGFGLDRGSYRAQTVGEELKYNAMRNGLVPGTFVALEEDVTVDINGTSTSFPAGTFYGEICQAQIDADGYPIKVWDPNGDDGIGSGDNFDGWYNASAAKEYMAKAVEELRAVGVEITKENPIVIDTTYYNGSQTQTNTRQAYKQSIESSLDGLVRINLVACTSPEEWYSSGYYCDAGVDMNFDVSFTSGWSADYADPGNYLDTVQPEGNGYQTINLGLW